MKKVSLVLCLLLSSCATVTITPEAAIKLKTEPTISNRSTYFFWGIVGEEHVDVKQTCSGKSPKQIQAQTTFLDGLLGAVTLGIYAPRTYKVWCS